jgi:hypothetical protein
MRVGKVGMLHRKMGKVGKVTMRGEKGYKSKEMVGKVRMTKRRWERLERAQGDEKVRDTRKGGGGNKSQQQQFFCVKPS